MGYNARIPILMGLLLFMFAWTSTRAQDTTAPEPRPKRVRPADRAAALREPELQEIRIEGCSLTTESQILGVIDSRESDLTLTRRFTRYFYNNLRRNPATPKPVLRTLGQIQRDRLDELRYYNSKTASDDSVSILDYLSQNGMHYGQVRTQFARDSAKRKNVLTFYITEGPQAVIDTIGFLGLERVPEDIRQKVLDEFTIKNGTPYSEGAIDAELAKMIVVLRNSGYYKARLARRPLVVKSYFGDIDTVKVVHDTVVVVFEPDNRVRIGKIILDNDENGWRAVDTSTRIRQLDFKVGEWYSEQKLSASRLNLISLNTFEIVTIDTLARDSMPSTVDDSTVWIRVYTKNSKPYEVGANIFVYQTAIDNFVNTGIGTTAQYRNLMGVADVGGVNAQYVLQDVSRLFQGETVETEALFSASIAVPHWWRFLDAKIGAQGTTYYSKRNLVSTFKMESFGATGKLPITLFPYTFFTSAELSLTAERQIPLDFRGARERALKESRSAQDSQNVISTFNTFDVLDTYLNTATGFVGFFTGVYAGATVRGEHRDNPIDPTRGHFFSLSAEVGTGAGKFLKAQLFGTKVHSLHKRLIAAAKLNMGHILLFDFARGSSTATNVYVPLDRQFFAGGASSIRSYPSRQLHDVKSGIIEDTDPGLRSIQNNILGSGTLFETSIELRYSFERPEGVADILATIIEKSGITWFADYGNAFNRLTTELYGTAGFTDFFKTSVLATGLGYRFATPVGPLRLDLATSIYDPSKSHPFIVNRPNALGWENLQLSIGLGHAF